MPVTRIVPRIVSRDPAATKAFYRDMIGLAVDMEDGDFLMLGSVATPSAQVVVNDNGHAGLPPGIGIDVGTPGELATIHDEALRRGLDDHEPLADKPWGIRRFSMLDPSGTCVTILSHIDG